MQNVAIPACFSQTVQRELELNPQLRNMPESAPGFSLLIHGPCVLWELPAGSWKAAGTKCGWGMWIVPVVPVPQWDISPLNLSEKVMIPQQFHKNFWNLFLLKPPLCPALLRAVNNCTSRMISPILGVEMLFLQLSRCAPNDIQFLFWAWKRRQEINSGLLEQENSAGKENCSLVGQGEAKAVRREGFESWHSSALLSSPSVCPALCGQVWLQEVPKAGTALPVPPCFVLAVGWAGTKAPICGRLPQRAPMPLKAGIDPCKETRAGHNFAVGQGILWLHMK